MPAAKPKSSPSRVPVWVPGAAICAILGSYVAALLYARERVPAGLNNDAAAEALRGLYLVEGRHFEVITFAIGNSAETLYLYLLGGMAKLLGATTLALQATSWVFALACIWLVWKLVQRTTDKVPMWVALLTAASSIWLFHYARSGLRAICAPVFLGVFTLLLERAERRPGDRAAGLWCGAVLGLSIYGYTSNRVIAIAFAGYAVVRLIRLAQRRAELLRVYGAISVGALVVSIPNLIFLASRPKDFLFRGSYVVRGGAGDWVVNTFWSAVFPFYYPEVYRHIGGLGFFFDGVSAGLTSSGFSPVHVVVAVACAAGVWCARGRLGETVPAFLVATWIAAVLTLGVFGPSLTRLLVLLPVYLVFAAVGFGAAIEKWPGLRAPVMLVLMLVGASEGYRYLSGAAEGLDYYAAAATSIGEAAEALAAQGQRVVCVVSRDEGVATYLTHDSAGKVKVVEFYQRVADPAEIPFDAFRPQMLLVEDTPWFQGLLARFPAGAVVGRGERFYSIKVATQ